MLATIAILSILCGILCLIILAMPIFSLGKKGKKFSPTASPPKKKKKNVTKMQEEGGSLTPPGLGLRGGVRTTPLATLQGLP